MIARVAALGQADNDDLLALAHACSTGSAAFRVARDPDFFALGRQLGTPRYFGARDAQGRLLASVGITRQRRYIHEAAQDAHYVHDLRVHPGARKQRVASHLLAHMAEVLRDEVRWCFASMLGENPALARLTRRGFVAGFDQVYALGKTLHVGLPLFTRAASPQADVVEIDAETFRSHYLRWARGRCLAPTESAWAAAHGRYFALLERGQPVVAYKLVDERAARRFVATRGPGILARGLVLLRGQPGATPLPRRGEELPVCYAAFHASRDGQPRLSAIASHARSACGADNRYLFLGLAESALHGERLPLGSVCFPSLHFGFGAVPPDLRMDFHELTLI